MSKLKAYTTKIDMKKTTTNRLHPGYKNVLMAAALAHTYFVKPVAYPLEGRWDMTIYMGGKEYPSWLEVRHSGLHMLIGQYVGIGGSARPISRVNFIDGKMSFSIPPQWDPGDKDLIFEATLQGDSLTGTMIDVNGKSFNWTAHRAPSLRREKMAIWNKPLRLLNNNDLKGWHAAEGKENQWKVENGILSSPHSGANLITDQTFTDFKLHIEFRYPKGSNSGVYLRGRYEVQVADSKGLEPSLDQLGAIYGFVMPTDMMAKAPGEWQSYDITLVGRLVTVIANGKTIICNQEIPGITGGALDSKEGDPGPLLIQGDHGPVDYRNIIITPAK
jgi:Domain of Unknown Function (DUF1080)